MITILAAIKTIIESPLTVSVLGALDTGLNLTTLFGILKTHLQKDSLDMQMICALDEALKNSCRELEWHYDSMATFMWLDVKTVLTDKAMTKESLKESLTVLTGKDIDDKAAETFIDCFDRSVSAAGKEELYRYLSEKWMRYIGNERDSSSTKSASNLIDFSSYYKNVDNRFRKKKRNEYEKLVGTYSDEEAYIDTFIDVNNKGIAVLTYLEEWFIKENSGTLLIYGEPGHGKTTLCNKAVVEFYRGNFLKDEANNVLAVSLNTGDNRRIIKKQTVILENALVWGGDQTHTFTFEDCRGSLLFMDGFDEFIDEAKNVGVNNIISFMKRIEDIADEYSIHIVVLSRTTAVEKEVNKSSIASRSFIIKPITDEQQDDWFECHQEYSDYRKQFNSLRDNSDMRILFGIPFLFRMIVHCRFDRVSTNTVELYDMLIDYLMEKRNIYGEDLKSIKKALRNLAYEIYCTDTNTAEIDEEKWDERWTIAFYIKQLNSDRIGFFHRSFYQFFLAEYIYHGILCLTHDEVETFIGLFAERELDDTVRHYLSFMIKHENKETINRNLELMVNTLIRTEAYLNLSPKCSSGDAENSKIGRTINIYRNTMHICAALSYVIKIPFKKSLDTFLRLFDSNHISIYSDDNTKANLMEANLRKADLCGANLREANLCGADLSYADLSDADLCNANLCGANLSMANLEGANLSGADLIGVDLSGANLYSAILRKANLSRATLVKINMRFVILNEAVFSGAKLSSADLSGLDMTGVDLSEADLNGTNLRKARLNGAALTKAKMRNANLTEADLTGANISGADLRVADLNGAILKVSCVKDMRIDSMNKRLLSPSIKDYDTIRCM